jgi:MFS family permease
MTPRALVIFLAGLAQGLALVTVPALAPVLTGSEYGLSSSAYGALFLPQAVMAVIGSLAGARAETRLGPRTVAIVGLALDTLAMAAVLLSVPLAGSSAGYGLLLLATAALGLGFGLCVPALNVLTAAEFPAGVDRATLTLNALLGLGTALAPLLSAVFVGLGVWWLLPVVATAFIALMLVAASRTTFAEPVREVADAGTRGVAERAGAPAAGPRPRTGLPARLWVFLGFAFVYGIVETVNGNWATVYAQGTLGESATVATLALAAFWGAVTAGRILFAAIERRVPLTTTYRVLPFVVAVALVGAALLPAVPGATGVLVFALAGLGCSALLPLTISLAEAELTAIAASVAGLVFAAYQAGYGVAAFGVGPLTDGTAITLAGVMAGGAILALLLGILAPRVLAGRRPAAGAAGAAA